MISKVSDTAKPYQIDTNADYEKLLSAMKARVTEFMDDPKAKIFTTNNEGLFDMFLDGLPAEYRQEYTCHTCKAFFNRYAGLVQIHNNGQIVPLLWPNVDTGFFGKSVGAIFDKVKSSRVTGVFLTKSKTLGVPECGGRSHFHAMLPHAMKFKQSLDSGQAMAEIKEDRRVLAESLPKYERATITAALRNLKSGHLNQADVSIEMAVWLEDILSQVCSTTQSRLKNNLLWKAASGAPPGYCHFANTMLGTLMDDIKSGITAGDVINRWNSKMHPLQYQRPQAAPGDGNIAQAEKIIEKLGAKDSLRRRYARLDDIQMFWTPKEGHSDTDQGKGVFDHLKSEHNPATQTVMPPTTITWAKFERDVLPNVESMSVVLGYGNYPLAALTTSAAPDSPPIIQWDSEAMRNPVSWYLYSNGSSAIEWGLYHNIPSKVTGLCLKPYMWNDGKSGHHGKGLFIIVDGAKDDRHESVGAVLFPNHLRSEFREIRSTIEAFSKSSKMEGIDDASAAGIMLHDSGNNTWPKFDLMVTDSDGNVSIYNLDRWE